MSFHARWSEPSWRKSRPLPRPPRQPPVTCLPALRSGPCQHVYSYVSSPLTFPFRNPGETCCLLLSALNKDNIVLFWQRFVMLQFHLCLHGVFIWFDFVCFFLSLEWQSLSVVICFFVFFSSMCKCCKKKLYIFDLKKNVGFQFFSVWRFMCYKRYWTKETAVLFFALDTELSDQTGQYCFRLSVDCFFDVDTVIFCLIGGKKTWKKTKNMFMVSFFWLFQ